MTTTARPIPGIEAARQQALKLAAFVSTFTAADLDRPTPCKGWLVRDILSHNTAAGEGVVEMMRAALAGQPTEPFAFDIHETSQINAAGAAKYRNAPDLVQRFNAMLASAAPLFGEIEARGMGDTVVHFFAPVTLEELACLLTADVATHTWDYGQAVGRPQFPEAAILANALPTFLEKTMPKVFIPEAARDLVCAYGLKLTDIPNGEWLIDINRGRIAVRRESIASAKVKTITDAGTFLLLTYGRLKPLKLILTGKLKSKGNPLLGMKFDKLFVKV